MSEVIKVVNREAPKVIVREVESADVVVSSLESEAVVVDAKEDARIILHTGGTQHKHSPIEDATLTYDANMYPEVLTTASNVRTITRDGSDRPVTRYDSALDQTITIGYDPISGLPTSRTVS